MSYFNSTGRCIPGPNARIFGESPSQYYVIAPPTNELSTILDHSMKYGLIQSEVQLNDFENRINGLIKIIQNDENYSAILNGVFLPFIYHDPASIDDLGAHLENILLTKLNKAFTEKFPQSHFKAVLQGNSSLKGQISLAKNSDYDGFIQSTKARPVVGLYFPQVFQEYDIQSQRSQMEILPKLMGANRCLSGGIDICSALIGQPDLLIHPENYSPILCLSAYEHRDPRLTLMLKSYGPHLEFWCMTQMLTHSIKQVSEQWSGGLTIYQS